MIVAIAGDCHGNTDWALERIREAASRCVQTILHVGDFGLWPGRSGEKYLLMVEEVCAEHGVTIQITPGNHEDWGRLRGAWNAEQEKDPSAPLAPLVLTEHLLVIPRGFRWEMGGRSFVSLGGAASVDYQGRAPGRSWWPEEMITQDEADACAAAGQADVMITHETPDAPYQVPQVSDLLSRNDFGWSDRALAYSAVSRARVTAGLLGVQRRVLAHGHMHVAGEAVVPLPDRDHDVRIWSLNMDGQAGNMRYLDLETLDEA